MSVLAGKDLQVLIESGMASRLRSDGTIKLHKRRLNRSSDEEHANLPLIYIPAALADSCFSTIPDTLISEPTLLYLGFTTEKANLLWTTWMNYPETRETDYYDEDDPDAMYPLLFIDFIFLRLKAADRRDNCTENDDEWHDFMDHCGINSELQAAIMDPRFTSIRLTNSCLYWLQDSIKTRYLGLKEIQAASHEREREIQRAQSRPGESQRSTGTSGQRSISDTMRERAGVSVHTSTSDAAVAAAKTQPGVTILFKGISQTRLINYHAAPDISHKVTQLMSHGPTDFLWHGIGGYFALDRDIAIKFAQYAKRRHTDGTAVLLQFNVPNFAIESLTGGKLRTLHWDPSGNDKTWEKIIYYSRTGTFSEDSRRLEYGTTLIIGTIAKKPNACYGRMLSYEEVDERCVFRNREGRPAVQYVFCGTEGGAFMKEYLIPSMESFPVTSAELAALRE